MLVKPPKSPWSSLFHEGIVHAPQESVTDRDTVRVMSTPGTLFWFHQQRAKAKEQVRPSKKPKGRSREAVLARPESCRSADFWIGAISEAMNEEELTNAFTELADSDASLPELCSFAADVLGKDARRIQAKTLDLVARYVSSKFDDAKEAQEWISERDLRLAAWTSYECVSWAFSKLPKRTDNITDKRAIKLAKKLLDAVGSSLRRETEDRDSIEALMTRALDISYEFYSNRKPMSPVTNDLLLAVNSLGRAWTDSLSYSCARKDGLLSSTGPSEFVAEMTAAVATEFRSKGWNSMMRNNLQVLVGVIAEAIRAYPG